MIRLLVALSFALAAHLLLFRLSLNLPGPHPKLHVTTKPIRVSLSQKRFQQPEKHQPTPIAENIKAAKMQTAPPLRKTRPHNEVQKISATKKETQRNKPKEKIKKPEDHNTEQPEQSSQTAPLKPQSNRESQTRQIKSQQPKAVRSLSKEETNPEPLTPPASVITKAEPIYERNPPPVYPTIARRRGWQGTVLLAILVEIDGTPAKIRIEKKSPYKVLDRSAVKAVKKWHFTPGRENMHPKAMWVTVPIRFTLTNTR